MFNSDGKSGGLMTRLNKPEANSGVDVVKGWLLLPDP